MNQSQQVNEELEELLKLAAGKHSFAEIGTDQGGTLYAVIQVLADDAKILSVDLPNGPYSSGSIIPTPEEMQKWKKPNQTLEVFRGDSKTYTPSDYDLVLIDGDHSYEGVKADYEKFKGHGQLIFHDIVDHRTGVPKLWNEIKTATSREIVKDPDQGWAGLGVL